RLSPLRPLIRHRISLLRFRTPRPPRSTLLPYTTLFRSVFDMLASDARLVWLGSLASRIWDSAPTDIYSERAYSPWRAYTRSKIAVQVFAVELARRFAAAGSRRSSVVADPGYSLGGLTVRVPGINNPNFRKGARELLQWPFAQGKHTGAAPVIHAASAPGVASGD